MSILLLLKSNTNSVGGNIDLSRVSFFRTLVISSQQQARGQEGQGPAPPESRQNPPCGQTTRQDPWGHWLRWSPPCPLVVKGSFPGGCPFTLMFRERVEIVFLFGGISNWSGEAEVRKMEAKVSEIRWQI